MSRQGKVEAYEYIADADLAANGGLVEGPKTKINIENLAAGAVPDASTTVKGKVELATVAEAEAGTDTTRAVTPEGLAAAIAAASPSASYLTYVAKLSQTSTSDPTVSAVYQNTLSGSPVPSRLSLGTYLLSLSGAFTANKTYVSMTLASGSTSDVGVVFARRASVNTISIETFNVAGESADDLLIGDIEIRVYP